MKHDAIVTSVLHKCASPGLEPKDHKEQEEPTNLQMFLLKANVKFIVFILQVHMKLKKIKCHLCGKRFPQNQNLLLHINGVHKKLRPVQCSICGKKFAHTGGLQMHAKKIHKKTIYENTI